MSKIKLSLKIEEFEEMNKLDVFEFYNFLIKEIENHKNDSLINQLIMLYAHYYNKRSYSGIEIYPNDITGITLKRDVDKNIYKIFKEAYAKEYGSQKVFILNIFHKIFVVEKDCDFHSSLISERIHEERFNIKNFSSFYNMLHDGYEYDDNGEFFNQSLFVEDWFTIYKELVNKDYFLTIKVINKREFIKGIHI